MAFDLYRSVQIVAQDVTNPCGEIPMFLPSIRELKSRQTEIIAALTSTKPNKRRLYNELAQINRQLAACSKVLPEQKTNWIEDGF